ncbi:autoinducer binding domain-containing protein [Agrobacterium sp. DKPNP3]|uniref:autoinducer binding domain-containing protein n=1 Tax=Agrobacterium sp. DKPNP3 TaxID=3457323 RepID=UPI0040441D14
MQKTEAAALKSIGVDCVREIAGLNTQFDIFRFLKRLTEAWEFKAFMVLDLSTEVSSELSQYTVITSWPAELLQRYDEEGELQHSRVMAQLRKSTVPFSVSLEFLVEGEGYVLKKSVVALFERFEMINSVWFPVHDVTLTRGAVSFSGNKTVLPEARLAELFYISAHVFARLSEIRRLDLRVPETLSEREIDCLNWTAAGKTSAEIAEIMMLSEHTINHYLNRATKKLDTVNRTQAVAKALRVGIIK